MNSTNMYVATVSFVSWMPFGSLPSSETQEKLSFEMLDLIRHADWKENRQVLITLRNNLDNLESCPSAFLDSDSVLKFGPTVELQFSIQLQQSELDQLSSTLTEHEREQLHRRLEQKYDEVVKGFIEKLKEKMKIGSDVLLFSGVVRVKTL